LLLTNPTNTFNYQFIGSAIVAARSITLPLLTVNDTMVTAAFAQTLTNKTINVTNNTLTGDSTVLGDILKHDGTSFRRFAKGTSLQVLRVNAGGTDLEWAAPSGGASPLTTKGDIYTFTTVDARLPVGINGQVLTADSAQASGLSWTTPTAGTGLTAATVQTTNATQTTVQTIIAIPTTITSTIEVYITTYQIAAANWGIWKKTLVVTRAAGAPTIQFISSDIDKSSTGLNANSVAFTVSGNDILVRVTGIAATTLDWSSKYRIV
jgi:hypothetical protein